MAWDPDSLCDTLTPRIQTDADGSGRVSTESHSCGELGWPTGLEPVTFGATIRCSAG